MFKKSNEVLGDKKRHVFNKPYLHVIPSLNLKHMILTKRSQIQKRIYEWLHLYEVFEL